MKIGLIDVDGHNFPNIPLMKLSAWHKSIGDYVEWYEPLISGHMNKVYISKIFSFTTDYQYFIDADEIIKGGSGYCIKMIDGKEIYDKKMDIQLPNEVDHIYPDYSIYPQYTKNTAYGRLTLGCPRGCNFCHTGVKDGLCSNKVANLLEFWNGQKNIVLIDQNIIACKNWKELLQQLIDSKAYIDFNGGIDIRLMTEEKAEYIKKIKIKTIHFAYDRYEDKNLIEPKFKQFKDITGWNRGKVQCYVLCNFNTTIEQDLERIYFLRSLDFAPYVMIYDKENTKSTDPVRRLQRWVNNRYIFWSCDKFNDYMKNY